MNNIMCYTEACLNLNFEALHKLMFNETVCLEVFAALSNWLNASTSRGHFISRTSLAALMRHVLSCCVKPVFSTALLCPCLPGLQKYRLTLQQKHNSSLKWIDHLENLVYGTVYLS